MKVLLIVALLVFWSLALASTTDPSQSIAHHHYYERQSTKANRTHGLSKLIHNRAPKKKKKQNLFMKGLGFAKTMWLNARLYKTMKEENQASSVQNAILKEREFKLKEKKICIYSTIAGLIIVVLLSAIGLGGYYFLTKDDDPKPIFGLNRGSIVSSSSPPPPPVKLNFQQTLFRMISDKFDLLFVLFILITSTVVLLCVVRLRTLVAKRILVIGSRRIGGGAGISRIYSQSPSTVRSYYSNQTKRSKFSRVPTSFNGQPSKFSRVPTSVNGPPSNFSRLK